LIKVICGSPVIKLDKFKEEEELKLDQTTKNLMATAVHLAIMNKLPKPEYDYKDQGYKDYSAKSNRGQVLRTRLAWRVEKDIVRYTLDVIIRGDLDQIVCGNNGRVGTIPRSCFSKEEKVFRSVVTREAKAVNFFKGL